MCHKCFEQWLISKGILIVTNIVIINDYIDYDNALIIQYSFN